MPSTETAKPPGLMVLSLNFAEYVIAFDELTFLRVAAVDLTEQFGRVRFTVGTQFCI